MREVNYEDWIESGYEYGVYVYIPNKKLSDTELEYIWNNLNDVPFIEDKDSYLLIDQTYFIWEKGKAVREEIWNWFDEHHSKGVGWLISLK